MKAHPCTMPRRATIDPYQKSAVSLRLRLWSVKAEANALAMHALSVERPTSLHLRHSQVRSLAVSAEPRSEPASLRGRVLHSEDVHHFAEREASTLQVIDARVRLAMPVATSAYVEPAMPTEGAAHARRRTADHNGDLSSAVARVIEAPRAAQLC